ncbi:hypothetical protein GCM10011491_08100 [Brucella endophytica]|uniref:Ribbon-helix-helix protein CopG domain-containing protein n=1 Tax=Brucella endophytica TaxID=1963359 RepID=A0A916S3T4_9HYPH|nr:hypothetical protein [Brucella endophytica]GGA83045.1 hypothetical protein GCM10011491_08100 [Brucella endophytica]
MSNSRFVSQLRETADRADASPVELRTLLRRAALRLDNTSGVVFEPAVEDMLSHVTGELKLGRSEFIQQVVREWLERNAYLPVHTLDEDDETAGSA